ncbi:MAG: type II toxin-antitoxin system VapC family toxin [Prevotellaceae bacterium]|jgi:predicted nucleic acid-binding protein|nr:type II toxin-antitoxin system VapC family toxin [Prevotellaceae bacterium]
MDKVDFVADTNAIIYAIEGNPSMRGFIQCTPAVSVITEIELLGKRGILPHEADEIRMLLSGLPIIRLTESIKEAAISLKQRYSVKLPDAVIAATALCLKLPLCTADLGFDKIQEIETILITP